MAQIKKKFLASNAVDGTKVQYSNNEAFRAKSSSGVDVELFKLDNSNLFQFLQLPRVGSDPSVGNDVTRKSYVDAQILSEAAARVQADAAEQAAREAAIAAEQSARETADATLQSNIDAEQAARVAAVSAEESRAMAAEGVLQSAIDAEQSRAEGVEASLQSQIDALDTGNAQALADEIAAREAADADLQSQVNTEKGRIDAILLASDADKDSFAEIVSLINSVDTENDSAFASYVLSNNAALAQEVSDRQAGDTSLQNAVNAEQARAEAAEAGLASDLAQEVSDRQAAVSAEQTAREAADSAFSASLAQEVSDRQAAVSAEQSRAEAAESDLQDALDAEVAARQSAVSGEEAARMAADSGIQSELDATQTGAGLGVDGSYVAPVGTQYLGSAVSLKDADSKLDAAIVAEVNARQTAVSNLEQGLADLDAAMTQGFDEAHSYTDQKVADLVNGAPALLDTLKELADAIGDDENFASNIMTSIGNEAAARQAADTAEAQARSDADSAEANARAAADTTLQNNIDAEASARQAADTAESDARAAELPRFAKVRKTLSSTDISNGYVDLDHVVLDSSVHVFIDRLACHADDDYTLSTVSGKTRVTFSSGFKSSEEGPGEGDLFRCGYAYKNEDQSSGGGGGGGGGGGSLTLSSYPDMVTMQIGLQVDGTAAGDVLIVEYDMGIPGMWMDSGEPPVTGTAGSTSFIPVYGIIPGCQYRIHNTTTGAYSNAITP